MRTSFNIKEISAVVPRKIRRTADNTQFSKRELMVMEKTTGIRELRVCETSTYDMALKAARELDVKGVQFVVFITQTPDYQIPGLSNQLAAELGLRCGTVDINAACNAFIQGLLIATSLPVDRVLLVFSEHMTKIQDPQNRNSLLFGDAAAAMIVHNCPNCYSDAWFSMYSDGTRYKSLFMSDKYLIMNGEEVFDFVMNDVMAAIKKDMNGHDYYVFHQSNNYILQTLSRFLELPKESVITNIERYGNTSGVSIPLALVTEKPTGSILACGYGAGMNWGTASFYYEPENVYFNEI